VGGLPIKCLPFKVVCATRTLPAGSVLPSPSLAASTEDASSDGVVYNARMFVPAWRIAGQEHLAKEIKFLVCKKGHSELLPIGGPWSSTLDGGDPSDPSSDALLRTLVRCAREQINMDLSHCHTWIRFLEIHYVRHHDHSSLHPTLEASVLFLSDPYSIAPTLEESLATWEHIQSGRAAALTRGHDPSTANQQAEHTSEGGPEATNKAEPDGEDATNSGKSKDDERELKRIQKERERNKESSLAPKEPTLFAVTLTSPENPFRAMSLSLDGLLDYDESDKFEPTFEVSLFAEAFHEMLQRDFAHLILDGIKCAAASAHTASNNNDGSRKRPLDEALSSTTTPAKRIKSEDQQHEHQGEEQGQEQSGEIPLSSKQHVTDKTKGEMEMDNPPREYTRQECADLLQAFKYFDRNAVGYLRTADLQSIMLCSGAPVSESYVQQLITLAGLAATNATDKQALTKPLPSCLIYTDLVSFLQEGSSGAVNPQQHGDQQTLEDDDVHDHPDRIATDPDDPLTERREEEEMQKDEGKDQKKGGNDDATSDDDGGGTENTDVTDAK
jgi:hypothetical protein